MDTIEDDMLRELRYCAAGPGSRHGGQLGRAQDEAVKRGWLVALPIAGTSPVRLLHLTEAGRRALAALGDQAAR